MGKNITTLYEGIKGKQNHDKYLTEQGELVVWEQPVSFIKKEISPYKFLETPVFTLDKSIRSLAFWNYKDMV